MLGRADLEGGMSMARERTTPRSTRTTSKTETTETTTATNGEPGTREHLGSDRPYEGEPSEQGADTGRSAAETPGTPEHLGEHPYADEPVEQDVQGDPAGIAGTPEHLGSDRPYTGYPYETAETKS